MNRYIFILALILECFFSINNKMYACVPIYIYMSPYHYKDIYENQDNYWTYRLKGDPCDCGLYAYVTNESPTEAASWLWTPGRYLVCSDSDDYSSWSVLHGVHTYHSDMYNYPFRSIGYVRATNSYGQSDLVYFSYCPLRFYVENEEYIGFETGTDFTYTIKPGDDWSYDAAFFYIIDISPSSGEAAIENHVVYQREITGFNGTIEWDGKANEGSYDNEFLPAGNYWAGIKMVPHVGYAPYIYDFPDQPNLKVVKLEILNPINPNKEVENDSDDFFFRGTEEPSVKIYYNFLPTGLSVSSVKLFIKDSSNSTVRQIDLTTTQGTNLLAQWDGKDSSGNYVNEWDYTAIIEAVVNGTTYTSNEHKITDLLYKHRPEVYVHDNELALPCEAEFMMNNAELRRDLIWPTSLHILTHPSFQDLCNNDSTANYMDLDNTKWQNYSEPSVIYCRGTMDSEYVFLQYWHFEASSCAPGSTSVYHEGDWEMFQIAVQLNTSTNQLQPIAVTASQHYYGQTIRWAETGNGPASQNQDYVGKSADGLQPKVYIATNSHATYFRQGSFRFPALSSGQNHGEQYLSPDPSGNDVTGSSALDYELRIFNNSIISDWQGKWGEIRVGIADDGPRSPSYRNDTSIYMWTHPKDFNNFYRKLTSYPSGSYAHPDTNIP